MIMKALSLRQPYANWVASGRKTLETRTWSTPYRGDVLICASQSGRGRPQGVALCVVELYGIRPMTRADEAAAKVKLYPRAQVWLLRHRRRLQTPFLVKGRLGLFNLEVDDSLLQS